MIQGLRVSPVEVVDGRENIRIIHEMTFKRRDGNGGGVDECDDRLGRDPSVCPRGREAGGFTESPGLRAQIGNQPRILIKKMDANNAFRQVPVEPDRGAAFGYVLGQYLIVDLRLEFGWGGSPAW